jgi:tripartite-type tricarboxylate transporter receptor subunit TctC
MRKLIAFASIGVLLGIAPALAQPYPARPITIIVPAAAGGPTDTVARLVGESMGRTLGQQVIVENVGGAGGTIGMARVARSAPDGYTLAIWHIAQATAPSLYDNLSYNVLEDFSPIGRITDVPMTIVGKAALPQRTAAELIIWIKERQKAVTYAHAGIGSASHLCAMMFMSSTRTQMTPVSYRGTGPAMNDLLGGQFDVMCDQTTTTTNQIKEGRIKGYAVTTRERLKVLPELPTLDEVGLKGFEATAWHAMWGPKGVSPEVQGKLTSALQAALKEPAVIERMASLGTEPVKQEQATPAALRAHMRAEVPRWAKVIKAFGVKAN